LAIDFTFTSAAMESSLDSKEEPKNLKSLEEAESKLCELCSHITLQDLKTGFTLGTFQEVALRARSCQLCALVLSSDSEWTGENDHDFSDRHAVMLQDVQGDLSSLTVRIVYPDRPEYRIKELRVWVGEGILISPYQLEKYLSNRTDTAAANANISPGRSFLATKSDAAFRLMNRWLTNCRNSHKSCQRNLSDFYLGPEGIGTSPARLLEVGSTQNPSLRLVQTSGNHLEYAALSYCWGSMEELQPLRTTKSNLESFTEGIPENNLPKTIQDATEVTRQLGLRHLWVDSLCIVQDDEGDWRDQSNIMGSIFGNAVCTIAATAASHCEQGLWYLGKVPADPRSAHRVDTVKIPCVLDGKTSGDIFISPSLPSINFKNDIESSRWSQRAWVIQERILSRRIIHFASNQLYWECHEAIFQECSSISLRHGQLLLTKPAMFQRMQRETTVVNRMTSTNRTLQTMVSNVAAFKDMVRYTVGGAQELNESEPILNRFWARIVLQYNCANITFNSDKLVAIQGLARSVARVNGQTYFAGLWLEDISRGLFWHASPEANFKRQKDTNGNSNSFATRGYPADRF
jgi:hypothetical protein